MMDKTSTQFYRWPTIFRFVFKLMSVNALKPTSVESERVETPVYREIQFSIELLQLSA